MKVYVIMGVTYPYYWYMNENYDLIAVMSSDEGALEYINMYKEKLKEEFEYDDVIVIEKNLDDVLTF